MNEPIWTILEYQDRTLKWLARRTGYEYGYIRKLRIGAAPITAEFRRKAAAAMDLPENVLFLCPECPTPATTCSA